MNMEFDLSHHENLQITILSDTHGALDPQVRQLACDSDVVLHAGDIMGANVLDELTPRLGIVVAVRGNNDFSTSWRNDRLAHLATLPEVAHLHCPGGTISMEHGHKISNIERDHYQLGYKYPDARMVVYGHTHVERLDQDTPPWLLNPGVAGFVRNQGGACCYQLNISSNDWAIQRFKFPPVEKAG